MRSYFIGIAGGTGAGKSTLCYALQDKHPDKISVLQLDDYFKSREEAPTAHGMANMDHPDSLKFDDLLADLEKLKNDYPVTVATKSERLNPDYKKIGKIPVEILPNNIILVEGYLLFWDPRVRSFFDVKIYLDVHHEVRIKRRVHFMNDLYEKKILIPMHHEYVEPTKQYADHVLNVAELTKEEVLTRVDNIIKPLLR